VAQDLSPLFSSRGVDLRIQTVAKPLWVNADSTRLAQVIGNLLDNAAKFTPRGGQVAISLEADSDRDAVIRVTDDGIGMSPETLAHLFEPFTQATQGLDRSQGGLGLGLALVKGLVEMHSGTVAAHSDGEGKGADFEIVLPLVESTPIPVVAVATDPQPRAGLKVLVIEDNVDAADSLREGLELGGHAVAVAYSGPEGAETAHSYKPDVVLCDLGLPGLDGFGMAKRLRADTDAAVRSVFLVALSGYAGSEDVHRAKEAGFDRHVAKPASLETIEKLLAEARVPARAS
jgi:CheY-like chemotaxis protein